jgi:hypothetical protein
MAVVRIYATPFAALFAALLAALPLASAAAPYTVRLGMERIALDSLPGFSDTTDLASPRLQDLAASLTSPSNRVLLFALTDADLRRFQMGDPLDKKRRYVLAVTPKELERERVSADAFKAFVADSLRGIGKPEQFKDLIKFLEERPIGVPNLLAEPKQGPTSVSLLQATRLTPLPGERIFDRSTPQYMVFTTTFALVRGKALILSVYTLFYDEADIDWLQSATQRWTDDIRRLNAR